MDGTGQEFFACPRFAQDQHRGISCRHLLDLAQHLLHGVTVTEDVFEVMLQPDLFLQIDILRLKLILQTFDVAEQLGVLDGYGRLMGKDGQAIDLLRGQSTAAEQCDHTQKFSLKGQRIAREGAQAVVA